MKATLSRMLRLLLAILIGFACASISVRGTLANQFFTAPQSVLIVVGPFIAGSNRTEHEAAYVLVEVAYGDNRTRRPGLSDCELQRASLHSPSFESARTPITNAQHAAFVPDTGNPAPGVNAATWNRYRLAHPFARTRPACLARSTAVAEPKDASCCPGVSYGCRSV